MKILFDGSNGFVTYGDLSSIHRSVIGYAIALSSSLVECETKTQNSVNLPVIFFWDGVIELQWE